MIGFGGARLNPGQVMGAIRAALVAIFAEGSAPWAAIVNFCTVTPRVLAHTTVILVQRVRNTTVLCGLQLVYSHTFSHPWGFVLRCSDPNCPARPGDVTGHASAYSKKAGKKSGKRDIHGLIRFLCKVCDLHCWVRRPSWIIPAHKERPFYFQMPWPLTTRQIRDALGLDQTWTPFVGKATEEEVVKEAAQEDPEAQGGLQEIEPIEVGGTEGTGGLDQEMPIWDGINVDEGSGSGTANPAPRSTRVMSPVSPERAQVVKRRRTRN